MKLPYDVVDRVLARLALPAPPPTRVGAERLFAAWCRAVPFDNVLKRIALASRAPLPGATAAAFFEDFLATGAGGTCWSTSNALCDLYVALGFKARRASAAMRPQVRGLVPNHGTVLLEIDGQTLVADASMLGETLLPLDKSGATKAGSELVPLSAKPADDTWVITYRLAHSPDTIDCRLLSLHVEEEFFRGRYEASREQSPFNGALYARKNREGSIVVLASGKRHLRTQSGVHSAPLHDRVAALVDEIGVARELAVQNPPDAAM